MDPIVINITDLTQGITQTDLSTPFLIATDKAMELKQISSIDDLGEDATASDNIYKMAAKLLAQRAQTLYVMGINGGAGAAPSKGKKVLEAIKAANVPHYYVGTDLRDAADRKVIADDYAAKVGFYIAGATKDAEADTLVAEAKSLNNESCLIMAHKGISGEDAFADCALIGKMAPVLEGTAPFFYQSLNTVPDGGYPASDVTKFEKGNICTVTTYMKRVETWTGKTTKGTYAHFKVLKDWLVVRLKEALAKVIHNDKGVFMSNDGLAAITDAMKEVLNVGKVERGVILEYTVYTPKREDIPANDRANGIVNGYQIQCTFTGFTEKVTVNIVAEV